MYERLGGRVVASLSILAALLASSCSGGSKDHGGPAPGCSRPAVSTAGPGDSLSYFPNEVGWSWTYRSDRSGSVTWTVTGTQLVGSETAAVWSTGELIVERPSGAYVLVDESVDAPLDDLYPLLVIPFPVATAAAAPQGQCTSVAVQDADGDAKSDAMDMVVTSQVLSVEDRAQVTAGSFTNLAHVQQIISMTYHLSALGTIAETLTQDDWYAPGVGLVLRHVVDSAPPYFTESETIQLVSYTPAASASAEARGAALSRAPATGAPQVAARAFPLLGALADELRRR